MDKKSIRAIFGRLAIPAPEKLEKIAVGFTNEVYSLDDKYILKVCIRPDNEEPFTREVAFYRFYEGKLPVPHILAHDASKVVIGHDYMVYSKIPGENLYNVWHTLTPAQRKSLIQQLCGLLRTVNATELAGLPGGAILPLEDWKDYIASKIEGHLVACEQAGTLSRSFTASVRAYVEANINVLDDAKVALTYWDAHFDNILVDGPRITGLIDFERTELASIDYALDVVWRMVRKPQKYMSEHAKQFSKDEDYANLMELYEEFYPELFAFSDLPTRLNLYEISHDLRDLELWLELGFSRRELKALAEGLARIVNSPVDI